MPPSYVPASDLFRYRSRLSSYDLYNCFPHLASFKSNVDECYGCAPEAFTWTGKIGRHHVTIVIDQLAIGIRWKARAAVRDVDTGYVRQLRSMKFFTSAEDAYTCICCKLDRALQRADRTSKAAATSE